MIDLIKIEFLKLKYGKGKFILLFSSLSMIMIPALTVFLENGMSKDYFTVYSSFFDINYSLVLPISIGIFVLSNICNEFKNKPIKNLITSKYSRTNILFSKYIVTLISSVILFISTSLIFAIISSFLSDNSPIYFEFKAATKLEILLNILQINLIACFYIAAIVSFCLMLGIIMKKQGISILIYIVVITFISQVFNTLQGMQYMFPRFLFTTLSQVQYLGTSGYTFSKFVDIVPCISNVFIFLTISDYSLKKYQY